MHPSDFNDFDMCDKNFGEQFKEPLDSMIYIDEDMQQQQLRQTVVAQNSNSSATGLANNNIHEDANCLLDFGDDNSTAVDHSNQSMTSNINSTKNAEDIAFDSIFTNDNG